MRKVLQVALSAFLLLALFCPVLCLASMADASKHGCCDHGKPDCSHASATQNIDLTYHAPQTPAPTLLWTARVAFNSAHSIPRYIAAELRSSASPPLVLRI